MIVFSVSRVKLHARRTCLDDQAQQAVGVEDEVGAGGGAVPDDGVHAPYLKVAGYDLQVVEDAPQVVLLQLQHRQRVRCQHPRQTGLQQRLQALSDSFN